MAAAQPTTTMEEEKAYTKSKDEVLQHFSVTEDKGLSSSDVEARRAKYGRNGERDASNGTSMRPI